MRKLMKLAFPQPKIDDGGPDAKPDDENLDDGASVNDEANDRPDELTLTDKELIGFIETLDKRICSLEHDLWVVRSAFAKIADSEKQS